MKVLRLFIGLCLAVLLGAGALAAPAGGFDLARAARGPIQPAADQGRPAYRLGAGDKLRVTVFNETDLSGDFDVNDQGEIGLPLIGQVPVAGKTLGEAQELVTEKYGAKYLVNPRVSIDVLNYRPFFIIGEVKSPGSYAYQAGMTVLNAVALAGGYTPRAVKGTVTVKHANAATADEKEESEDSVVLPGDVIRVKERFF
jgi:polysaccharide export outer membrane protein